MPASKSECAALISDLHEAYMEVFPAPDIVHRTSLLEPGSYVAVTCSPTKGVEETLDLTGKLVDKGFRVIPHIAAKNVADETHIRQIMRRLSAMGIESIFVPGGDRSQPVGEFETALDLLQAISEIDHDIPHIGVAAHPEGHPDVSVAKLFEALSKKQAHATYIVTQMCFDAAKLGEWLTDMRSRGITLPVWIGLPGVIERSRLLKASFRIGVGDSLRFLKKKSNVARQLMRSSVYRPDDLVFELAKLKADSGMNIAGYHLFSFNQLENTERWRHEAIASLNNEPVSAAATQIRTPAT